MVIGILKEPTPEMRVSLHPDAVKLLCADGNNVLVNPAANDDPSSPIFGMPILEVHRATHVIVIKRGMSSGYAGIENPLFFLQNTKMLFGDAKKVLTGLVAEVKGL